MKQFFQLTCLALICLAGCDSSSSSSMPPGAKSSGGPPGSQPSVSLPPGGIQAGKLVAVVPESWGEANSFGGAKSWKVETDAGNVFVSIFTPTVSVDEQVKRFQAMIDPSSAVTTDSIDVGGNAVKRVKGNGTRRTFSDDEMTQVARELPGEGIIGIVFGSGQADLSIMVNAKSEALNAFAPEFEAWIKSFK